MKTKILLFALLCGALNASEPDVLITSGAITIAAASEQHGKIIVLPNATGDWIPVTPEEAADVVKAMEIFSSPEPDPMPTQIYSTTPAVINAGMLMMGDTESPDGLRRRADWLEKLAKVRERRAADLTWAHSILELWKKKLEGAK